MNTWKNKAVLLLLLAGLLLTACGGDPAAIDRAEARRIDQETQDASAARTAEEAREQADWQATRAAVNYAKRVFSLLVTVTLAVALSVFFGIIIIRWWQASRAIVAFAEGRAMITAATVRLDRQTHTWPALVLDGAVHNLETGQVYRLGTPRAADPQQVTGSVMVRALGAGTRGAVAIGKATGDSQASDTISTLAGALPLVLRPLPPGESRRPKNEREET